MQGPFVLRCGVLVVLPLLCSARIFDFENVTISKRLSSFHWQVTDGSWTNLWTPQQDHTFGGNIRVCDFEKKSCTFTSKSAFVWRVKDMIKIGANYFTSYNHRTDHTKIATGKGGQAANLLQGLRTVKGKDYHYISSPVADSTCGVDFWYMVDGKGNNLLLFQNSIKSEMVLSVDDGTNQKELLRVQQGSTGGWVQKRVTVPLAFRKAGVQFTFTVKIPSKMNFMSAIYAIDDIAFIECGHFYQTLFIPGAARIPQSFVVGLPAPLTTEQCLRLYYITEQGSSTQLQLITTDASGTKTSRQRAVAASDWQMLEVNLAAGSTAIQLRAPFSSLPVNVAVDDVEVDPLPCPTTTAPSTTTSLPTTTLTPPATTSTQPTTSKAMTMSNILSTIMLMSRPSISTSKKHANPISKFPASQRAGLPRSTLSTPHYENDLRWPLIAAGIGVLVALLTILVCGICVLARKRNRDQRNRRNTVQPKPRRSAFVTK